LGERYLDHPAHQELVLDQKHFRQRRLAHQVPRLQAAAGRPRGVVSNVIKIIAGRP
jgi:hypothetical protein